MQENKEKEEKKVKESEKIQQIERNMVRKYRNGVKTSDHSTYQSQGNEEGELHFG